MFNASLYRSVVFIVLSLFLSTIALACPTGDYTVTGWNPGVDVADEPSYTGTATVVVRGDVCELNWRIGEQQFGGVGFFDAAAGLLAVGYADLGAGWFGQASYTLRDGKLVGIWTTYGDAAGQIGHERLTPR